MSKYHYFSSKSTAMDMVKLNSLEEFQNLPLTSWSIKQPLCSDDSCQDALATGNLFSNLNSQQMYHILATCKAIYPTNE